MVYGRSRIATLRRSFVLPFSRGVDDVQFGHGRSRRHCPRETRQNAGAKLRGRDRLAEEKPLDLITVGRIEKRGLAGGQTSTNELWINSDEGGNAHKAG
ncbi:hypothetical protein IVA94_38685 [Bradyrhizobium sp. 156]|uniref:hypothetical protein n=1 Tax=Bradyrhizobium sp. 156 TaxID=2782630 RepID=UPI001FF988A8|nr:hypothetical protein [Bradyrhizobium sp. 156]MCK1326600.1 hypothetical protein [Bradyrhizobium sp. 156]